MTIPSKKLRSIAVTLLGWILVLIGLAALALPGPGLLALFAGLSILASRYEWAERRLDPVKKAAFKAARNGVSSLPRIIGSTLAALFLICLGLFWGISPPPPTWWPISDRFWLIGAWGTGGTLIGSGIIAGAMLIYSYIKFRPREQSS